MTAIRSGDPAAPSLPNSLVAATRAALDLQTEPTAAARLVRAHDREPLGTLWQLDRKRAFCLLTLDHDQLPLLALEDGLLWAAQYCEKLLARDDHNALIPLFLSPRDGWILPAAEMLGFRSRWEQPPAAAALARLTINRLLLHELLAWISPCGPSHPA